MGKRLGMSEEVLVEMIDEVKGFMEELVVVRRVDENGVWREDVW